MVKKENIKKTAVILSKYTIENRVFKISIFPSILFSFLACYFHFRFQKVINALDNYMREGKFSEETDTYHIVRYAFMPIFHHLFSFSYRIVSAYILQSILGECFKKGLTNYIQADYQSLNYLGSGEIQSLAERHTEAVVKLVETLLLSTFYNLFFLFVALEFFFKESKSVVWLMLITMLIYFFISYFGVNVRLIFRKRFVDSLSLSFNKFYGIIQNHDIIKAYGKEGYEIDNYSKSLDMVSSNNMSYLQMCHILEFLQKLCLSLPTGILVYALFRGYAFQEMLTYRKFKDFTTLYGPMRNSLISIVNDFIIISENFIIAGESSLSSVKKDNQLVGSEKVHLNKDIIFNNVSLVMGDNVLLESFSYKIKAGEKIAIIGKNGCGKSSFINMLLRFIDYDGDIYIDNIDVKSINKKSVRNMISFVPQNNFIFEGSVLDNLVYSNNNIRKDAVIEISKKFNFHSTFKKLQNGYETEVGESGRLLSGGQKQKISFMRAVLKDGDIFILDEPTSSYDQASEKDLIYHILNTMKNKTVFLVIHNSEILEGFDKIFGFYDHKITVYDNYQDFYKDKWKY